MGANLVTELRMLLEQNSGSFNGTHDIFLSNTGTLIWIYLIPDKNNERNVAGTSEQLKQNVQYQELYKTMNV
jgi:hypothetical protein